MIIRHMELLPIQRELHNLPRGMERFRAYLRALTGDAGDVDLVPLGVMNPMGREHVVERLDDLLEIGAEQIAAVAVEEAASRLGDLPGVFRHGLVIADDVRGGWTDRHLSEAAAFLGDLSPGLKRHWISTILWAGEKADPEVVRRETLRSCCRAAHFLRNGKPESLRALMGQEGAAARFAGIRPTLDADDIEYTLQVLEPLMEARDYPTCFAAMYGDDTALKVGYPALGLSPRAGFEAALALTEHSGN